MASKVVARKDTESLDILPIRKSAFRARLVGETPLIFHSMSLKARQSLLRPAQKARTEADRAARGLKHNPLEEYRESVTTDLRDDSPTLLVMPATSIKGAIASTALDTPGSRRSEIGRLVRVEGYTIPIWGKPALRMDVVRMADISRTPDIRTRACVARWATEVTVSYIMPKLTMQGVGHLLAGAGLIRGIGDWRMERGSADFGLWRVCDDDDAEWHEIVESGGRAVQVEAMENPELYNFETEELYTWFCDQQAKAEASVQHDAPAQKRRSRKPRGGNGEAAVEAGA